MCERIRPHSYKNPAALLNLTIVGGHLVPSSHKDSLFLMEGCLFDVDNAYIYTGVQSEGVGEVHPADIRDRGEGLDRTRQDPGDCPVRRRTGLADANAGRYSATPALIGRSTMTDLAPPVATLTVDSPTIRLSDTLLVTLRISGPSPLRVESATDWLAAESAAYWKIEPKGAAVARQEEGTEHWEQVFRLSPFVPGEAVPLEFRPVRVSGQEVPIEPLAIRVETSLTTAQADDARPVTGVEPLPLPPDTSISFGWIFGSGVIALFLAAVVFALVRRRRVPPKPAPEEWVRQKLTELRSILGPGTGTPSAFADVLTEAVRGYLIRRFRLPAEPYTTTELLQAGDRVGVWPGEARSVMVGILEACDRMKFAGHQPSTEECRSLLEQFTQVLTAANSPPR